MAGGSARRGGEVPEDPAAAMEPRPDGRGKEGLNGQRDALVDLPQWSPGLMAGGS